MEVAAIARNIARALKLNEDLAETISLAHDLGHSPFGHKGESALNELMKDHGGFEHNRQSLRIVEELEQKYPAFSGLNLTWEVREGLVKHSTTYDQPENQAGFGIRRASLEAQVANLADEIAYYSHDLDDGIDSGLLSENELEEKITVWHQASQSVKQNWAVLEEECRRCFTIRCLIDEQVRDVVTTTETVLKSSGVRSADEVRSFPEPIVRYSPERLKLNLELRDYLYSHLYSNPKVAEPNLQAVQCLREMFHYYLDHSERLGETSRKRIEVVGKHRAICDYLAGMTDRYLILEYHRWIRA
jgi:dGTPase